MPKRRRSKGFSWIWFVAAIVVGGLGTLTVDHADSLKEADPARDVLAYEALGVLLVVLGVMAFVGAAGGFDGFELSDSVASTRSWFRARHDEFLVRQSLFFGVFGALGATLGWFTWVAIAILVAHPHDVWVSAVVGATVGTAVDGGRRYREVARGSAARGSTAQKQADGLEQRSADES